MDPQQPVVGRRGRNQGFRSGCRAVDLCEPIEESWHRPWADGHVTADGDVSCTQFAWNDLVAFTAFGIFDPKEICRN